MIDKINDEFIVDCTNNSKEERQQVYKFLVDNRNYDKGYLGNDFSIIVCNKKQGNTNWRILSDAKEINGKNYNVYTFEQFKEMYLEEEFVLPEKWCIEVTDENRDILNNYRINIKKYSITPITYKYMYKDGSGDSSILFYAKEITFKQFLKYILKQETMKKEIIGYKLVKSEYKGAYKEITGTSNLDRIEDSLGKLNWVDKAIKDLKEAGVLELWFEPVYATSEQIVSMNGKFNLIIRNKKVFHQNEDITSFVEEIGIWWKNVMLEGNLKFGKNYDFLIPSHNIKIMKSGCQSQETYLSNWLKVYDLIK